MSLGVFIFDEALVDFAQVVWESMESQNDLGVADSVPELGAQPSWHDLTVWTDWLEGMGQITPLRQLLQLEVCIAASFSF